MSTASDVRARPGIGTERGLWPEGFLAGVASLAVAWPLTGLLRESGWLDGAVLLVLVVVGIGGLLRTVGLGPVWVVLSQLAGAVLTLTWRYLPDTTAYLLPTAETLRGAGALLREAATVLQTYAAPAPTTEGVEFLVVAMLTLTVLSVDAIGVSGHSPATAGIPLAAAFLVSVSNSGLAMEPYYFVAVAVAWLAMVARQGDRLVRGWASADRREAIGSHDVSFGPTGHRTVARVLGLATVVGALLLASLLPHLPPTFFGEGLARNPEARTAGGGQGEVRFTETMDLTADLNSRSREPVLRYRTSGPPEPLRVTATREFDDGRWEPPSEGGQRPVSDPDEPFVADPGQVLAEGVATTEVEISVEQSSLRAPHLAVPAPVERLDPGVPWYYDPGTDSVRVRARAPQYRATYLQVAPRGQLPEGVGAPVDPSRFRDVYLEVDPAGRAAIEELAEEVVGESTSALESAVRMQNHLRSGLYRYSLTLAPGGADTDPVTHFLQTRQGYCVQFATAMVMMARSEGIPARMAVGFLAGEQQMDGTRTVVAADAHTWPELWIDGLGWTRFEPTPGARTGLAPAYTQLDVGAGEADPTPGATPLRDAPLPQDAEAAGEQDHGWLGALRGLGPDLGRALLVVLGLAGLMALVPWAGRRYREAGVRAATTADERVEGQWLLLTRTLQDLGVDPPPQRSPREMRDHYRTAAALDGHGAEALTRVAATLERARYAPGHGASSADDVMGRDVRTVVATVERRLPWNVRTNSKVLPRSGLYYLRDRLRHPLGRR